MLKNMSDVPELDDLLEEAERRKISVAWERQDRFFRRWMGCAFISLLSIPVLGTLFGKTGVAAALLAVLISTLPILILGVYFVLHACFTDPPRRDHTKRYIFK